MRSKRFATPSGTTALLTFDPAIVLREADKENEILWDVNLATRLMRTGTLKPQTGAYKWGRLSEVANAVKIMLMTRDQIVLSVDLETHGLYPWYEDRDIVTSQWTLTDGYSLVVDHTKFAGPQGFIEEVVPPRGFENWDDYVHLKWLFSEPRIKVWGANLKFDAVWIAMKWNWEIENFTFDTTLGGSIINENRSNSLNNHTKIYVPSLGGYDDEFNQTADKSDMPSELKKDPEGFLLYSGGDSDATFQVGFAIGNQIRQDYQLARFYEKILHPAARCFERIERRGIVVDSKRYAEIEVEVQKDIDRLTHDAMMAIPMAVRAKHADKLSLSRPSLLRDAFFSVDGYGLTPKKENMTAKTKAPQTTQEHFKKFLHTPAKPLIEALEKLGSAKKTMSTYIVGFLKHLRPDGRFHPTYALHHGGLFDGGGADSGTVSGRLAAKEPAIQTLPKHTSYAKMLRSAYPAPLGYEFWQCDFSQGELRVTAELADEQNMIKVYQGDGDLHSLTAAELNGYKYEDFKQLKIDNYDLYAELRQGGKAGNFGLLYGMGAKGFMIYAFNSYGVVLTLKEAQAFRNKFLNVLYPRLPDWHEESIEYAKQWKMIRSPLGRIRHLPLIDSPLDEISSRAERQAINSPVQSCLNDICLYFMSLIENRYGDCEDLFSINGSTHDAIYGYVREGEATEWFPKVNEIHEEMHGLFRTEFEWDPAVDFPVEWERGPSWAKLQECHPNGEFKVAA
jgi:DNA polymerase I-like protein with 3'-5' exonuclease and polymerase domains